MALSKLAIGLIAGIGSVAAVGGITAGVVVSRQNANQIALEEEKNDAIKKERNAADSRAKRNSEGTNEQEIANEATEESEALKTDGEKIPVSPINGKGIEKMRSKESTGTGEEGEAVQELEESKKIASEMQTQKDATKQPGESIAAQAPISIPQDPQSTEAAKHEVKQEDNQDNNVNPSGTGDKLQALSTSSGKEKPATEPGTPA